MKTESNLNLKVPSCPAITNTHTSVSEPDVPVIKEDWYDFGFACAIFIGIILFLGLVCVLFGGGSGDRWT